ncbi:MAG: NAD(P)H-dependent glycerol-3-phosphate dehydrogenase [Alicyclobacillus sp.]|nr:NAD(P)H-dependent glycerol-3-phosphate dehydrogenase [Alicyclobacillus sp.]
MNATVLGAGSWGTALALVLADNGHATRLWARRPEHAEQMVQTRTNPHYLPGVVLPAGVQVTADLEHALWQSELVVFAVPSMALAATAAAAYPYTPATCLLVHAVKGFDLPSKRRMSEVLLDTYGDARWRVCVLTGPSHAEEVAQRLPTTLVAAAFFRQTAEAVQDVLMNPYVRVYTNPDVVGAELGGALKNIIALGVGVADGLGFGDNAKAALMTRGLAEMSRLGRVMGASPLTFAGLSGVGDLVVTCTSRHSRNFRAGRLLGQGQPLHAALQAIGMVVEGVSATQAAVQLAQQWCVEMPISEAIHTVLLGRKDPRQAVDELMGRARRGEIEEVARDLVPPTWQCVVD